MRTARVQTPRLVLGSLAPALVLTPGCIPSEEPGFDAASPSRRLDAIVQASDPESDPADLPRLIEQLDSQDAAARMLAIRSLEARTGTTLGYIHTDPEWKRQIAIDRWIESLKSGVFDTDLARRAGDNNNGDPIEP